MAKRYEKPKKSQKNQPLQFQDDLIDIWNFSLIFV